MSIEDTYGKKLIRTEFNPSGSPTVDEVKHLAADMIDRIMELKHTSDSVGVKPGTRAAAIAITKIEDAAMWAVKAVTEEEK